MITQLISQLTRLTDSYGRTDGLTDGRSDNLAMGHDAYVTRAKGSSA